MEPQTKDIWDHLDTLPQVVQDAILNADIPKHLRELHETHKLHLDKWDILQKSVMNAVVGLTPAGELPGQFARELGLSQDEANNLALNINERIFEPIRQELERGLGSPQAKAVEETPIEAIRTQAPAQEKAAGAVIAATPAAEKSVEKAVREPLSTSYTPAQPSHERKDIAGDPYREQVN